MWTGLIGNQIIGPVQLPNPLNAVNYLEFLQDILPGLLDGVPEELQENLIFMHDGAPAHTAVNVRNYLDQVYGGHWIGNNGPVRWPARSPDLNPLDYFYWGTSKEAVYHNGGLNDPNDMIRRIQHHAQHLEPEKIHEEGENGGDVDVDGNDENGEDDDDDMNNDGENDGSEDGEADDSMDEDDDDVGNDPDWEI
ncbi:kinesin-related protein 4-like [Phymastichus coffea]|uniref:kinesin-related protein 4-like n=1 Tax=Phymastichus coffea TaxID=108790 RepID=UPI00273CED12|nr:kinesin-related protein 4-like [Phymastichus coffea]